MSMVTSYSKRRLGCNPGLRLVGKSRSQMFPFLLSGRFHVSKHELLRGSRRSITFTKFLDFPSPCAGVCNKQQLCALSGNTAPSARGLKQRVARMFYIRLIRTALGLLQSSWTSSLPALRVCFSNSFVHSQVTPRQAPAVNATHCIART